MLKAITLIILNLVVIMVGGYLMNGFSHRTANGAGLGMEFGGYKKAQSIAYWHSLKADEKTRLVDDKNLQAEKKFLQSDLIFPFVYGGFLFASLHYATKNSCYNVPVSLLLMAVALAMASDWVENIIQLRQLASYVNNGEVNSEQIQLASWATQIKLYTVSAIFLMIGYFSLTSRP